MKNILIALLLIAILVVAGTYIFIPSVIALIVAYYLLQTIFEWVGMITIKRKRRK